MPSSSFPRKKAGGYGTGGTAACRASGVFILCRKRCGTGWELSPPTRRRLAVRALDHNSLSFDKINLQLVAHALVEAFFHQDRQVAKNKLLVVIMNGVVQTHAQLDFCASAACRDLLHTRVRGIKILREFLQLLNGSVCDFHKAPLQFQFGASDDFVLDARMQAGEVRAEAGNPHGKRLIAFRRALGLAQGV